VQQRPIGLAIGRERVFRVVAGNGEEEAADILDLRAMGPTVSMLLLTGSTPLFDTNPNVGRRPVTPQKPAGTRTEPPVSVPSAASTISSATATAEPPLEPPGMQVGFHGFRHWP
jgi:hypothetical protein